MTHFRDIDASLEIALNETRAAVRRQKRGRVVLVLERLDGRVADWWVDEDDLTSVDVDRLMREKPRGEGRCL